VVAMDEPESYELFLSVFFFICLDLFEGIKTI